jgi:precorrin-2/cobalt-factor-2 C20-methyltransferase
MNKPIGKLYGIGVGPGDPDLLTLKAVKVLQQVAVVFTAASSKNDYSLALEIARPHIPGDAHVRTLAFPMTQDLAAKEDAWVANAGIVVDDLRQGHDAAFLTLGDSLTFSTFGYLLRQIEVHYPDIVVETVPGITSYQASASALNMPLVEGEESLLVLSGAQGGDRLKEYGAHRPDNVVFMKAYRNVPSICAALDQAGMLGSAAGVVSCSQPGQELIRDVTTLLEREPNYWTLIIAKKPSSHGPQKG